MWVQSSREEFVSWGEETSFPARDPLEQELQDDLMVTDLGGGQGPEEGPSQINFGLDAERPEVVITLRARPKKEAGVQFPSNEWARRPRPQGGPREGVLDGERCGGEFARGRGSEEVANPAACSTMDLQR
jgi:hypothetical protein